MHFLSYINADLIQKFNNQLFFSSRKEPKTCMKVTFCQFYTLLIMINHLFSGDWRISETNRQVAITCTALEKSKFFRITCSEILTKTHLDIMLYIDKKPLSSCLCKGSSIIVQGKSVILEQNDSASGQATGFWETILEPRIEFEDSSWAVHPPKLSDSIMTALDPCPILT
jgi:hypothetical protein